MKQSPARLLDTWGWMVDGCDSIVSHQTPSLLKIFKREGRERWEGEMWKDDKVVNGESVWIRQQGAAKEQPGNVSIEKRARWK